MSVTARAAPFLRALFVLVIILGAGPLALAITGDALDPARTYAVDHISISGNLAFADQQLFDLMETKERPAYQFWKPRPMFDPATFVADLGRLQRFYESHGYYRARIDHELGVDGALVTAHITIREGAPVTVAAVKVEVGSGAPPPLRLEPAFTFPLSEGAVFDEGAYQVGEEQLADLYTRHGYAHAQVGRRAEVRLAQGRAYVWYTVAPGPRGVFGPSSVAGERNVDPGIILRELAYKPGDLYDSAKVAASRQHILALNLFSSVEFVPGENPANPSVVPIRIQVREKPPRSISLGIGYNTQSQFNASLGWRHYNWLGDGRQLSIDATYSNVTSSLDAKLLQPDLFTRRLSLVLEAKQEQENYQTYLLNASRFDPHLDYEFSSTLSGSLGWRYEYLKFNSLSAATIAAVGGVRRNGFLSGPNASLILNTVEDPLNPKQGEVIATRANVADGVFGSDYRYWRATAEMRKYQSIGWETVFAARVKLGLGDNIGPDRDIPLSERYYSGGEGSVRGYGLRRIGPLSATNQPLGGLSLVESSVELRRPLFWKFTGTAFFDCGQVSTDAFRIPIDALQCGWGPGLGVATPVGPLRLDLGVPTKTPRGDSNWQLYFGIGQFF